MEPILNIENLSKSFYMHERKKTIPSSSRVSFKAYPGKLLALTGPTGAGKSSVLKCIYRTYRQTEGRIIYKTAENDLIDLSLATEHRILELRRHEIGFVTQFLHTLPRQKTLDVVATPLYRQGISREQGREQASKLLHQLNIPERLWEIPPATFSGGEKQRVNLARGMIASPRLLLLDEPTASLDADTTDRVIDLIKQMKTQGVALLAIFHQADLVKRVADHVVELTVPTDNQR